MKNSKIMTVLLLGASLALGSCSLKVADTKPGAASATIPVTAVSTVPDEETARYILNQSANAMLKVESYDYTSTSVSRFGNSEVTSTTKATVFPIKGDGWIETTQNEKTNTTYLKANVMYMLDPRSQEWVYVDMPNSSGSAEIIINAKVNDYITLSKNDSGYILKSTRPLSALEFYRLTGIEQKEMKNLADMVDQGTTLETVVEMELDSEYRYRKVTYDQVTTTAGVSTSNVLQYEYTNYNSAKPIEIPAEILEKAVKLQTQPSQGSNSPDALTDSTPGSAVPSDSMASPATTAATP